MVAVLVIVWIPRRPGAVEDVVNDILVSSQLRHRQLLKSSFSGAANVSGATGSVPVGVKRLGRR